MTERILPYDRNSTLGLSDVKGTKDFYESENVHCFNV